MMARLAKNEQPGLLSRDDFRAAVFARDNHACVVCRNGDQKLDAHHIIERRLFADGGYYVANGATVCEQHHLLAEQTVLSCDELRALCGIGRVVLPPHLYDDMAYDKWGNPLVGDRRLRGDLFYDESVQKVLAAGGVLPLFDAVVKYPRTPHLPWSPGRTKDDRMLDDTKTFDGRSVVVTLKMDGENSTIYRDRIHARSIEGESTRVKRTSARCRAESVTSCPTAGVLLWKMSTRCTAFAMMIWTTLLMRLAYGTNATPA